MADVSVEFGAKDTGLEATLKTVQAEMSRLDAEIKSGELSFNELNKAMRNLAQAEKVNEQLQSMASATQNAGDQADAASSKIDNIAKQTDRAGKEAEDFGEKSNGGFLKMSGAVAAGQLAAEAAMAGIRAAINLAKGAIDEFGEALDLGGRLSDLAARTGEAEGNLLLLERAFQNSGAGAEAVGPAINKLQNFMQGAAEGGAAQTAAMEKLGLSMQDMAGKTPIQQLETFAQRISGIEDPTQRTALAMDVFGRSGGELLPLLTNFSGELGTAQGQLGGMVDIMNRNAATFDAVSDKIAIVQGKFMEFAAGILDRIVPALDAVTEGLSRIDAAKIGQELADAFAGGTQAMKGFQATVDAFKTGNISEAFSLLWESVKLQGLQTANEVGRNLVAGFSTAIDFLKEIFDPSGSIVKYMGATFLLIGSKLQAALGNAMLAFIDALPGWFVKVNPIIGAVGDAIRGTVTKATEEANDQWSLMYHSSGEVATQIAGAASRIKDNMNVNLSETGNLIGGLNERAEALRIKQEEVAATVKATNEAKQAGIDLGPIEEGNAAALLEQEKQRLANELATSAAKGEAAEKTFAQIENEIELNNAIATGNQEEIKRVQEKQKAADIAAQIKANEESIPAIIEDIIAKTGTSEETARGLAEQLVASKNAALGAADGADKITGNLAGANAEAKTVKGLMDDIANAKMEASPERLKERTKDARKELKGMADFIGDDLSQMPLDDIIDKLGLDPDGKLKTADEKLRAVEGAIKDIGGADPADITPAVDETGVNDKLEKVKGYLANLEKKRADATPKIDQEKIKTQASATRETITKNLKSLEAEVTVKPKFNKEALKAEVDMVFASSKGTEHLANIDKLVDVIKGFVEKIEGKLPMRALAY
jgi:hypothetical protein